MLWDTAFGQYLDAQNPTDEASYWRVVAAKSGPYFRCAFEAAALACQAAPGQVQSLAAFGHTYGELVQLNDDLHDCMEIPANPDWFTGRMPLLFLFAEQVDHPDRQRFIDLRPQVSDPACLEEAQTILVRCGAASYAVHHILKRCHSARHLAESLPYPTPLIDLLDKMEQPILALLHTASS
jgi:geranylgeranyl pyrophosphate synthase